MNSQSAIKDGKPIESADQLVDAVTIPVDAYLSRDYARAEGERLWRKVWLQVGRVDEIAEVGDFFTYDILDDSIIIARSAPDRISAYHNVCMHRGRRLVDTPPGALRATGRKMQFRCGFHGWRYNLQGECIHILEQQDWNGALTPENTRIPEVQVDTWGGWVWINLDSEAGPLRDYLEPMATMVDPFETQNMRYRWRKWGIFDCNWKVAMEAFDETYHVETTHPEFMQFGNFRGWAKAQGLHSNIGYEAPKNQDESKAKLRLGTGSDPRKSTGEMQLYTWENANTNTTRTLVDAALRLVDELPEGTPGDQVLKHWLTSARADDAARGVIWPTVDPVHVGKSGTAWQIFPNFQIGHSVNNLLCYSARPYGDDPDKCYFEAAVYELFPKDGVPETDWEFTPTKSWPSVLQQDFQNMVAVQKGMKSAGFPGTKPNPYMERTVANLHLNLSKYMGSGAPRPLT